MTGVIIPNGRDYHMERHGARWPGGRVPQVAGYRGYRKCAKERCQVENGLPIAERAAVSMPWYLGNRAVTVYTEEGVRGSTAARQVMWLGTTPYKSLHAVARLESLDPPGLCLVNKSLIIFFIYLFISID